VWLNSEDPHTAFQRWPCSSSPVPLWKEELVPAAPGAPAQCPPPFGSPSTGGWHFCSEPEVGITKLCPRAAGAVWSPGLRAAPAWLQPLPRVWCPGEFHHRTSRPCQGRHTERLLSLDCFCLCYHLLKQRKKYLCFPLVLCSSTGRRYSEGAVSRSPRASCVAPSVSVSSLLSSVQCSLQF